MFFLGGGGGVERLGGRETRIIGTRGDERGDARVAPGGDRVVTDYFTGKIGWRILVNEGLVYLVVQRCVSPAAALSLSYKNCCAFFGAQ